LPIQPDSENPVDTTEMAAPIGEAPGADALPVGEDMTPEAGSNDTGDLGGDLGADLGGGLGGDMGGGAGALPAEPVPPTPEELLLERSSDRLLKELNSFFKKNKIKDTDKWNEKLVKDINNHLIEDKGWNLENLETVVSNYGSMKDFYNKYTEEAKKKKEESKNTADINSQNPQQTQDLSAVDPNINSKRSNLMKQVVLKDGILVPQESNSSKSALDNLTGAIRKTKASIKNLKEVKIKKAGIISLKASGKKFAEGFDMGMGAGGMGMDAEEPAKNDLASAISELAAAIDSAMTVVEDLNVGMDAGEMSDADNLFESAGETMGEGKELLEDEAHEEGETPEFEAGEEEGVEEGADEEPAISEKNDEEEDEKSATIMKKIIQKVAQIKKEASSGETIGVTKTEQKIKVNKNDLSGDAFKLKDNKSREEKLVGETEFDAPNTPAKGVTMLDGKGDGETGAKVSGKSASVEDDKTEEIKIRKSVSAAVDKARLSVELAARQQLKGLIDNPLKTAFVNNMVEYGVEKSAAEAIAHNAFIDGFEDAQKNVIKEAFETFMEKSFDDFVKVAEFTKNYTTKFAADEAVEETAPSTEGDAPAEEMSATAALRGTPVKGDISDDFTGYWNDVKKKYFK
jgi:hypothetical protein